MLQLQRKKPTNADDVNWPETVSTLGCVRVYEASSTWNYTFPAAALSYESYWPSFGTNDPLAAIDECLAFAGLFFPKSLTSPPIRLCDDA
jgi:hypothetical protein